MKPILITAALCAAIAFSAAAQSKKVFSNLWYDNDADIRKITGLRGPTIGYGWANKNAQWHEIELTGFQLGKTSDVSTAGNIGLQYQFIIPILPSRFTATLKPTVAAG